MGVVVSATTPFSSRHIQRWLERPAPLVGQHNRDVLRTVLGYSEERIDALQARAVIGTVPQGL